MLFIAPAALALLISFYLPVLTLAGLDGRATAEAAVGYLQDALFWNSLLTTLTISAATTLLCLLFGVPTAMFIAYSSRRMERLLITLVVASLFTSILLRSFVWYVLLGRHGPLAVAWASLGGGGEGSLLFTRTAVVLGMTHILLPTLIVMTWAPMRISARSELRLSYQFSSSPLYFLFRIALPANGPSIAGAAFIIFILSVGFYVTPLLLGGGRGNTSMIGVLIDEQVNRFGSWTNAAALSLLLVLLIAALAAAAGLMILGLRRGGRRGRR
jgi:ABC-type spermidine/putrescine transport system permease subunit I